MIILKILLWIILAVIGVILLILVIPASAEVSYIDKKFTYKISYGFINMYDSGGKGLALKFINKRKNKKPDKDSDDADDFVMPEPDEVFDNTEDEEITETESEITEEISETFEEKTVKADKKSKKKPKKTKNTDKSEEKDSRLDEKIELVLDLVRSADRPLLHICKGFRFSKIYIDFMIADEDAYKCALNYGRISGAVYNLLGYMATLFKVSYKTVDIFPDFKKKENRFDASVKCSFQLVTPLIAGIYFLIIYMFRFFIPQKMQERKLKKAKKSEK